jgi:hypothetical protein
VSPRRSRVLAILAQVSEHEPTTTWAVSLDLGLSTRYVALALGDLRRRGAVAVDSQFRSGGRMETRWAFAEPQSPIAYRLASERGAPVVGDLVLAYDDWPRPLRAIVERVADDRFYIRDLDGHAWRHAAWRVVPLASLPGSLR